MDIDTVDRDFTDAHRAFDKGLKRHMTERDYSYNSVRYLARELRDAANAVPPSVRDYARQSSIPALMFFGGVLRALVTEVENPNEDHTIHLSSVQALAGFVSLCLTIIRTDYHAHN